MERLQELKKEVAAQEMKLRSLQHQQQLVSTTFGNINNGNGEQEAMSALIFLKEKELALALMKVAELTGQLEHLKKSEAKFDSPSKMTNKSASSLVSSGAAIHKVPVDWSDTKEPVFSVAPTSQPPNHIRDSNNTKTVVYFKSQPLLSAAEKMRQSTSFDSSCARSRRRSTMRDQFFSSSFNNTSLPSRGSVSYNPSSTITNDNSTTLPTSTVESSLGKYSLKNTITAVSTPTPLHRHSTSSSIMSRFAPKPYSSRSMSVDCGIMRRPLNKSLEARSPKDNLVLSSACTSENVIPEKLSGSISCNVDSFSGKASNFCLLPKSASFHYGHSGNTQECSQTKSIQLENEKKRIDTSTDSIQIFPQSNNVPTPRFTSSRSRKPKITPKPVHLLKEFRNTFSTAHDIVGSPSHSVHTSSEQSLSKESPSYTNSNTTVAAKTTQSYAHFQPNGSYGSTPVSLQNNLTITLCQGSSSPTPDDKNQPSSDNAGDDKNMSKVVPDIFKKGGVKELSRMFSQAKDGSLVSNSNKRESLPTQEQPSSSSAEATVEQIKSPISSHNSITTGSCASNVPTYKSSDSVDHLKTTSVTLTLQNSQNVSEVDISANAVSSALSILLSSSSSSCRSSSRHSAASRPNRLFGYSPSFARPKFSLVPSEQRSESYNVEKDTPANVSPVGESSSDHRTRTTITAPTIYSLFSPPPKTKLSLFTGEASPCSPDKHAFELGSLRSESRIVVRKNNIYLPRLSYITLSSDSSLSDGERGPTVRRVKTKKRVTIDPNFLFLNAAVEGELDVIKTVISQVSDPNLSNDNGMTALHGAVYNDHMEIVKFLLDYGCNVNASNSESWTPLHYAALANRKDAIELLVTSGACVFALTASDHEIPLQKCQSKNAHYNECIKILTDFDNQVGNLNDGLVYSMADYNAEHVNEFSLKDGEMIRILRRGDEIESEWWWATRQSSSDHLVPAQSDSEMDKKSEGYVPRSILSLHPRRPKLWRTK